MTGSLTMPARASRVFFYLVATAVAAFVLMPFLWMLSTSFKEGGALLALPIRWIPEEPTVEAYREIFSLFPFARAIWNSVFVAASTVFLTVGSASLAAYVFAKMRFPGREVLFIIILATLMIPRQVTIIPLFIVLKQIGLINTFTGLLAPTIFHAFGIFMLRQHMLTIPDDYLDAAAMDGASQARVYAQVIVPLAAPAMATLSVLVFMEAWNDYFWPLVVLSEETKMTLNVALSKLNGQYQTRYNLLMAGSLLSMLPMILVYLGAQKYFRRGLQVGGLK
jgi:multiple sugar transport system permease protein